MPHPLLRCFALYRHHLRLLVGATVAIAVVNASLPLTQYFIGRALHEVELGLAVVRLPDGRLDLHRAWMWAEIMVGVALARSIAQYLSTVLSAVLGQRLLHTLRASLFAHVQRLDVGYHLRHGAGELINRATRDSDKVRDAVVYGYRSLIELVMIVSASLFILCWYHWSLALVPLVLVGIAIAIGSRQSHGLVALNQRSDLAYDQVAQDLSEGVHGVRVIKAFSLEKPRITRFVRHVDGFAGALRQALSFNAVRLPLPQLIVALGHIWVLGCGAYLVSKGLLNRGELVAAMMAMQSIVFRVESIGRLIQIFADARASAGRVMELLDAPITIMGGNAALPARPLSLHAEGVTVRGPTGEVILDQVSFAIHAGEIVALVGATGSGKSTLASLLPRLRDPDSGRLLLGSGEVLTDLRSLDLKALRQAVQVVYQDSFLFSDSLAGNLRVAKPDATDAELLIALEQAAASDVLAALPDGLASRIGERGVTLSGGQRQRVCVSRALLCDPAVLCLDDATSALDAVTERALLGHVRGDVASGARARAVLIIASKLSTISLADRVMILEQGRIIAVGTHEELITSSAFYRELLGLPATDVA